MSAKITVIRINNQYYMFVKIEEGPCSPVTFDFELQFVR